jgi:hypothetical protein
LKKVENLEKILEILVVSPKILAKMAFKIFAGCAANFLGGGVPFLKFSRGGSL